MKKTAILLAMSAMPFFTMAQQNETVKADKHTQQKRAGEMFNFPDNIKLSKNELNERVEQKTETLTKYIKALAEKKETDMKLVDEAMKLFNNNEYATVSVTRRSQAEPETVPVRTYLKRLNRLKYDKVRITWHNAQYVSNFTKQPNGNYMGLVAFEQEFTGVKNGETNYTYRDVTQKHVEVTVKIKETGSGNMKKGFVEVFLGNIGVEEQ